MQHLPSNVCTFNLHQAVRHLQQQKLQRESVVNKVEWFMERCTPGMKQKTLCSLA